MATSCCCCFSSSHLRPSDGIGGRRNFGRTFCSVASPASKLTFKLLAMAAIASSSSPSFFKLRNNDKMTSFSPARRHYQHFDLLLRPNSSSSAAAANNASSTFPIPSPPPPLSDVFWPASGAFVAMAVMSAMDKWLQPMGLTFTIAPFGAVCTVLFVAPNTPAAKKYNIFVAHMGCAAIGVAALALLGPGWIARSAALAASLAFMQYTGSVHPPAAALPLLFLDVAKLQHLQWWYILFPSAVGCVLLCLMQQVVLFLRRSCRF